MLTVLSMAGVILGMVNYAAMVFGKVSATSSAYMAMNLLASILVGFSLVEHFNPATLVLQIFYAGISAYGLLRCIKERRTCRRDSGSIPQ